MKIQIITHVVQREFTNYSIRLIDDDQQELNFLEEETTKLGLSFSSIMCFQ